MEQQQLLVRSKSNRRKMGLRHFVKACWTPPMSDCECYGDNEVIEHELQQQQQQQQQQQSKSFMACLPDDLLVECLARVPRDWLRQSAMVCQRWRRIINSDNYYKVRRKVGRVEGHIMVFGVVGASVSFSVYSQTNPQWKGGEVMAGSSEQHAQAAVVKHRIFMVGGSSVVYDTWSKSVKRACPMLLPRKKFACCVISNRILVAGGASRLSGDQLSVLKEAEEYIPELDTWRRLPDMPRKRFGCIGAAVDGIFYVIGGIKRLCVYVGSMDSFDPATNTWLKSRPLPMGAGCVISCTVVGSCIYMLSSHAVELSFWKYDTRSQLWSRINLPPVPSPLRIDKLLKFCCVTLGTAVHIIQLGGCVDDLLRRGGRNTRGIRQGLVLVYQTHLQEWSKAPHLPHAKCGAVCAVVEC